MAVGLRSAPIGVRFMSAQAPSPEEKANSIVEALPGNNWFTKTATLATTAGAAIYGIANNFIIIHDETILVLTFTAFATLVAKFVAPLYTDFANGEIKNVNTLLNESRNKHINAVQDRIDNVAQLRNVVALTKDLFSVSKETTQIEAKNFEKKQQISVAAEAKSVLDSWVRFETAQRQLEQEQLVKSVSDKVAKEIENPKFQDKVLAESVAEVEKLFAKN